MNMTATPRKVKSSDTDASRILGWKVTSRAEPTVINSKRKRASFTPGDIFSSLTRQLKEQLSQRLPLKNPHPKSRPQHIDQGQWNQALPAQSHQLIDP